MPKINLKAKFRKILFSLADFIAPAEAKKELTRELMQKEVDAFIKASGINGKSPDFNPEKFQSDFTKYLKSKNYSVDDLDLQVMRATPEMMPQPDKMPEPKNIKKVSQDLNKYTKAVNVFVNTTEMMPGLVCYVIEKIEPTDKTPFVRYKPSPCVITQIHDNGVNGGTIFFSYEHKLISEANFSNKQSKVVSESKVIYSPLTKEHAIYICKLLNAQSRLFYQKAIKQQKTK
ncbi:MAG: hypothetical protein IKF41_02335 [Alphaproteobacteria bacterium]|nr:hypothetical protein [Alphaproteobacteria bacterium]